ncbi:hypothetical protein C0992_006798 [Termitomyces sp. T32_za158]|nr:hypothetical protein C0992_006798 [Termitomyces sp. T32_za158]
MKREPQTSDNDVLVSQVRAFLEAAEDVDIDVETVEDLIQSLPSDFDTEIDPIGEPELTDDDGLEEDTNVNEDRLIKELDTPVRYEIEGQDTLETLAGVQRVLQCHGSFATASCLQCRRRVPGSEIEADIMDQKVALCTVCNPAVPTPKKKRGKKKAKGQWDSNDEDESDDPAYPSGIMKVL